MNTGIVHRHGSRRRATIYPTYSFCMSVRLQRALYRAPLDFGCYSSIGKASFGETGGRNGQIRACSGKVGEKRDAPAETWSVAIGQRRKRRSGKKPKTGHRHRPLLEAARRGRASSREARQLIFPFSRSPAFGTVDRWEIPAKSEPFSIWLQVLRNSKFILKNRRRPLRIVPWSSLPMQLQTFLAEDLYRRSQPGTRRGSHDVPELTAHPIPCRGLQSRLSGTFHRGCSPCGRCPNRPVV